MHYKRIVRWRSLTCHTTALSTMVRLTTIPVSVISYWWLLVSIGRRMNVWRIAIFRSVCRTVIIDNRWRTVPALGDIIPYRIMVANRNAVGVAVSSMCIGSIVGQSCQYYSCQRTHNDLDIHVFWIWLYWSDAILLPEFNRLVLLTFLGQ